MSLDHSDLHFEVTECAPVPRSLQRDCVARVLHDCDADEVLVSPKASWRSKSIQRGPGTKTVINLASAVRGAVIFSGSSFPVLSKKKAPLH